MKLIQRLVDIIFKLYLGPVNSNYRVAMSARNRLLPYQQHLAALVLLLRKNKNDKGLILDIGSYDGGTSAYLAKKCPRAVVIGFEANNDLYTKSVASYGKRSGVVFENFAVSGQKGFAEFYISDNKVSSSVNKIVSDGKRFKTENMVQVATISLDEYLAEKGYSGETILALKIDVQGHELNVFNGADKTLCRTEYILVEMANHDDYQGGAKYHEVDAFLRNKGFLLQNLFADFTYDKLYEFDAIYTNKKLIK